MTSANHNLSGFPVRCICFLNQKTFYHKLRRELILVASLSSETSCEFEKTDERTGQQDKAVHFVTKQKPKAEIHINI